MAIEKIIVDNNTFRKLSLKISKKQAIKNKIQSLHPKIYVDFNLSSVSTSKIFLLSDLSKTADLKNICFFYPVTKNDVDLSKNLNFSGSVFLEKVDFSGCTFNERVNFSGCTFKEATFDDCTFEKEADFANTKFLSCKEGDFRMVNFKENANFNKATFQGQKGDFWGTTFHRKAFFTGATFITRMNFCVTTFCGNTYFQRAKFETNQTPQLQMDGAVIEEKANLTFSDRHLPKSMDRGGASLLKFHHDQRKDFIKADEFYHMEMDARRREVSFDSYKEWEDSFTLSKNCLSRFLFNLNKKIPFFKQYWILILIWQFYPKNFLERFLFYLSKVFSNFGQNWLLPLLWIVFFNSLFYLSLFINLEEITDKLGWLHSVLSLFVLSSALGWVLSTVVATGIVFSIGLNWPLILSWFFWGLIVVFIVNKNQNTFLSLLTLLLVYVDITLLFFIFQNRQSFPISFGEFVYPFSITIPDGLKVNGNGWQPNLYVTSRIISAVFTYLLIVSLKRKTTRKY